MQKSLQTDETDLTLCVVLGTRPSIVKQSPLIRVLERRGLNYYAIHTGQHYSYDMDRAIFEDLGLPEPRYRLPDLQGHASHGAQTGTLVAGIESVLMDSRPGMVLVGGDTNSDLAAALAARKLHVPIGHVEAGLRSYDWRMPEEHNRVMIDHISEVLFPPTANASRTLEYEHVRGAIFEIGSTAVDAVLQNVEMARKTMVILTRLGLHDCAYGILTLHREENVDSPPVLAGILRGVARFAEHTGLPVIFAAHPRTQQRLTAFGLDPTSHIRLLAPLGYLDFLQLLSSSSVLMTDSGGALQEACILHVPCVTLRNATEWVETLDIGANVIAGVDPEAIVNAAVTALESPRAWANPFGDGTAGERAIEIALECMASDMTLAPPPSRLMDART